MGLVLLVVFCIASAYCGTRLGVCWTILEERYPEFREAHRRPYPTIAECALGPWARRAVSVAIQMTLFGGGVVYIILTAHLLSAIVQEMAPGVSLCWWMIVVAALLTPLAWLGSPKDFWYIGTTALISTVVATLLLLARILMIGSRISLGPHPPATFQGFTLSFGVILFSFAGASTFPTIQNDMEMRSNFPKSVALGFTMIIFLYFPISAAGYVVFGSWVSDNLLTTLGGGVLVLTASLFLMVHVFTAFIIIINPVCQELEDIFDIPRNFCKRRCACRSVLLLAMLAVAETIPDFGKVLSLVGGSSVTFLTFVCPPVFYMVLCDDQSSDWPQRNISLPWRVILWEIVFVGVFGGAMSTYAALHDIFGLGFTLPCYLR